jgi:sec-independent protein translocase protein TatA
MGPLGWQETVFIFLLALLVFGPKKLPELGKTIGKAITEFRRASNDLKATFDREMNSLEREGESLREITSSYQNEITSNYNYDSSYNYEDSYYGSSSNDSTASNSSTVSASATEGAESTTGVASDSGEATTSAAGKQETPHADTGAAEYGNPVEEPHPAYSAGDSSAPESKAVTT